MWFKTIYVKMFVGDVGRKEGVKKHLSVILEAEAMHKKGQQVCD